MFRSVAFALLGLVSLTFTGCGDRYKNVVDQQVANWKEITSILREVKDRPSMDEAESKLLARAGHFQDVSRQAKALPPPDQETSLRLAAERGAMQSALRDMIKELDRIKSLPSGPEFFDRVQDLLSSLPQGSLR